MRVVDIVVVGEGDNEAECESDIDGLRDGDTDEVLEPDGVSDVLSDAVIVIDFERDIESLGEPLLVSDMLIDNVGELVDEDVRVEDGELLREFVSDCESLSELVGVGGGVTVALDVAEFDEERESDGE